MDSLSASSSVPTNCLKLDNLPDDVFHFYIFNYLDLDDVLELRLVNKKFYSIVNDYNITSLYFVHSKNRLLFKSKSFASAKPTRYDNRLMISQLGLLNNPAFCLSNLRFLKIDLCPFLDDLNKFKKLQALEIDELKIDAGDHCLELPELQVLSICNYNQPGTLEIDSPNLHSLKNNYLSGKGSIKYKNPLSVKYLNVDYLSSECFEFKNLECLEFELITSATSINVDLSKFSKLKKFTSNLSFFGMNDLFKEKNDLEIVLEGVKIKTFDKIDEYTKSKKYEDGLLGQIEFQLDNYSELDDNLNSTWMNYNELVRLLPDRPADLCSKYSNIQSIEINSKIDDTNGLIQFIKGNHNLRWLETSESSLDQAFYDQLPSISSLTRLLITEHHVKLNFGFIMNMPTLVDIYTNQDVQISEDLNLNSFKHLERFLFKMKSVELGSYIDFTIYKKGIDQYAIMDAGDEFRLSTEDDFSFSELVLWFEVLQMENKLFEKFLDNSLLNC